MTDNSLELADLVGRLILAGFEGRHFPEVAELITRVRPAGLIFFKRNYDRAGGPAQLRELIASAQALAQSQLGRPLLMAIDHEGGLVQRLPTPYTRLPAAAEMAANFGPSEAAGLTLQGARELAATGFNLNMAPVLDVARPGSFIGSRSFGDSPELVTAYGRACLAAYHQAGLLGVGKHFPGLGAAMIDPHHDLPTLATPASRLRKVDLSPFQALGREGLAAIMTTHARYPSMDGHRPVTFSGKIVGRLKRETGFGGAVLTDDLEMGAVVKNIQPGEAAVQAILAGHDLALICRRRAYINEAQEALATAVRRSRISPGRLADATGRTEALLSRLSGLWPAQATLDQWFGELLNRRQDQP
ncbi:MAG: beta-N-acetylhexosaminidase [Candidatus Adiutrix sp.]|jgi:beta-N-acetylhexosaminidase|nr:beta-N-acetylhexosaminidase [Candidatus Adiutrix sp.]